MQPIKTRPGFALPVGIMLLLALSGAVFVTLEQGSTERRIQDTDSGVLEALVLAETGLERFATDGGAWGSWSGGYPIPTAASGVAQLSNLGEELGVSGFAEVRAQRVWWNGGTISDPDEALYAISSTGVRTQGGWSGAPQASRVVSRLVRYERPLPIVADNMFPSAWTSLSGLVKNGSSGELNGNDAAGSGYDVKGNSCGNFAAKAGVAVPADPGYDGHLAPVSGDPPVQHIGDTPEEAAASIDMDWKKLVDPKTFPSDEARQDPDNENPDNIFVIPDDGDWDDIDTSVESTIGGETVTGWDSWPVIVVRSEQIDGDFEMPMGGGKGTIIVTGDATISGQNLWEGVALIGGTLTSNGNNTVSGAVLSGLNLKLGVEDIPEGIDTFVGEADAGNGTKTFEYHSCYLANAMAMLNDAVPPPAVIVLGNTWLDTWAQY